MPFGVGDVVALGSLRQTRLPSQPLCTPNGSPYTLMTLSIRDGTINLAVSSSLHCLLLRFATKLPPVRIEGCT